jgi:hypothetical protein
MIGIDGEIITAENHFIRRQDSGLDERIYQHREKNNKDQDDPDAAALIFHQMTGATERDGSG